VFSTAGPRSPGAVFCLCLNVTKLLRRFTLLFNKGSMKRTQFRLNSETVLHITPLPLLYRFQLSILQSWPPLWSSGQSSWLQIQRSGFDSRGYQSFWEAVGLERGPLSLVNTIEESLAWNSSGSGLENREYGRRDPSRWPRDILCPQKLALTLPTIGGHSAGIIRSRTKATEFSFLFSSHIVAQH
jgi:hypothetical protein